MTAATEAIIAKHCRADGVSLQREAERKLAQATELEAALAREADAAVHPDPTTWLERLWLAPDNTHLGVAEVAEACGRSASWVYRHTAPGGDTGSRLPHRKLDGELLFLSGEVRMWLTENGLTVEAGHTRPALIRLSA